ncbi:hypothetical protein ACFX14_005229 [Malus domestica]
MEGESVFVAGCEIETEKSMEYKEMKSPEEEKKSKEASGTPQLFQPDLDPFLSKGSESCLPRNMNCWIKI